MENNNIEDILINEIGIDVKNQYLSYKVRVEKLASEYNQLKKEAQDISKVLKQMQNENIIDSHLTKLFSMINNGGFKRQKNNEKNIEKINLYFQKVQNLSIESLKLIFEIRKFFTGQEFDIFIENEGKIYSFSIEDIERHAGNVIPIYTNSVEKLITNMDKNSRSIAPELNKLGLTLKNINNDFELKGIQPYLDFVNYHVTKKKLSISENRKLEAAIYLYGRNDRVNFNNDSDRHSLHTMLGWYISKGGTKDTITMYKLGDALRETSEGFKNIEIKMHNGTISLTMIANGIKKLNDAFSAEDVKEKIKKFFGVNKNKLSSPIEKAAEKEVMKSIDNIFKQINLDK